MGNACPCSTGGGVGLWDVVASGVRPGSLDQHISQERPNDIAALLDRFPGIGVVCCNGTASHKYLKRYFPRTVPSGNAFRHSNAFHQSGGGVADV